MSTTTNAVVRRSSNNQQVLFPPAAKSLRNTSIRKATITALSMFADADAAASLNMVAAGKLYRQLLDKPLDELIEFIKDYCEQTGIPMPELPETGKRGRPISSGRNILAAAVYGRYPELLEKDGKRDTKGGKRVTACLHKYDRIAGGRTTAKKRPWPKTIPRSARGVLLALMGAATAINATKQFEKLIESAFGARSVKQIQKFNDDQEIVA